jgi:hypothetical protein
LPELTETDPILTLPENALADVQNLHYIKVRKCVFDCHDRHCRGLLAVDSDAAPEVRIRADPSAPVHAVGLVHTGHEEDQPNARLLNKISETLDALLLRSLVHVRGRAPVLRARANASDHRWALWPCLSPQGEHSGFAACG